MGSPVVENSEETIVHDIFIQPVLEPQPVPDCKSLAAFKFILFFIRTFIISFSSLLIC